MSCYRSSESSKALSQSSYAMVVDKAVQNGNEWYYQCKNSYKSKPQVFVGHQNLPSVKKLLKIRQLRMGSNPVYFRLH